MTERGAGARHDRAPLGLTGEVTYLKGAGPLVTQRLRALGIERVLDLLLHLPLRYEDRRRLTPLTTLRTGSEALVRGEVRESVVRSGRRRSLQVRVEDDHGVLFLRFFHFSERLRASLANGREIQVWGQVRLGPDGLEMVHPELQIGEPANAAPGWRAVYPLTTGLTQARLHTLVDGALAIADADPLLAPTLAELGAPETRAALHLLHRPPPDCDAAELTQPSHPARLRLIREELLAHQLCMRQLRARVQTHRAVRIEGVRSAGGRLQEHLPFALTGAQRRVLGEIADDMARAKPMLRLLQGDVGCGKTLVAAAAMLATAGSGCQAAMMAPTELLAEQHARSLAEWFAPLGVEVGLLHGRLPAARKRAAQRAAATGAPAIWVGTHALAQDEVRFPRLGLVVIDEQHRFGVGQRLRLRDKAGFGDVHQLVMSATPIPRTLAQTLYADLDVSVIDELPPGRSPVQTVAVASGRRDEVVRRIGSACADGRQAYWVCTLIEDSEALEAQAAEAVCRELREALPHLAIGLIHGRLKAAEKEAQMRAFQNGDTHLLVATTVIEVGVDVPNASIMVIDNAERLGLAQLHQLRGRVGRGRTASQCLLLYQEPLSQNARARLDTLRRTQDGFEIAQRDLELRGPGELLGRRQTGLVGLRVADPLRDAPLIAGLQPLADRLLSSSPALARQIIRCWIGEGARYGGA